jgi:hypothetical protein
VSDRPTVADVVKMVNAYYRLDGNSVGGNLHVVLSDGNLETKHVEYCRNHAAEQGDVQGVEIADAMLAMSITQRNKVYHSHDRGLWS